jgi:hypothetical protein
VILNLTDPVVRALNTPDPAGPLVVTTDAETDERKYDFSAITKAAEAAGIDPVMLRGWAVLIYQGGYSQADCLGFSDRTSRTVRTRAGSSLAILTLNAGHFTTGALD